ncbi:phosphatidylinositol N-acetylglucosaminyltransferase NDAI_0E02790 [Naumovozyma dairenensis CBS 421]|uniref:Phosphatidylinositol N-acetylglucosaminyltransferase n=1 Tax=Naumovozyma dairenensis (strain ATCC 10597 / BCRC 20456 / CBS 421 / NBRC 0211 / NRRL Y-12639) TaxID=1071378 RepID=G0WBH6_NAUDC|nr:hypothetical protein NDAI_0E02790 [Naumovozyma dairenensis CBS 421]CCD25096.1 hypothetical protein NDAI_0E02790 [Naumovozyma dairenensis CBS 421]
MPEEESQLKKPWTRLLWLKQDYPDNYTDPTFLKFMENLRERKSKPKDYILKKDDYEKIRLNFLGFYHILLNTCFIFICFTYIYEYKANPVPLTGCVSFLLLCLSISNRFQTNELSALLNFKSSIILIFIMLTVSPILKSLSKTTASDSIWTLSFWLTIFYTFAIASTSLQNREKKTNEIRRPSNLSTNILLANVSVLASRLSSTTDVFCFLTLCIELNIILPSILKSGWNFTSLTISNLIVYVFLNISLGLSYTLLILAFSLFYLVVLPRWFFYWRVHYHRDDVEILTIWDPKTPIVDL